jgi:hypothetical protein
MKMKIRIQNLLLLELTYFSKLTFRKTKNSNATGDQTTLLTLIISILI